MRLFLPLFLLALLIPTVAAEPPAAALTLGDTVPTVTVREDTGASVQLTDVVKGRPAILVFYRGGWCPYCMRHLSALAEVHVALAEAGFSLIAISPDRLEKLRARPETAEAPFRLLSDSEARAARAFGIAFKVDDALVAQYKESYGIDLEGDSGQTHHLLPHPAVFVVDARGIIRFAHVNPDYKMRLTPEEIMSAAKRALAAGG